MNNNSTRGFRAELHCKTSAWTPRYLFASVAFLRKNQRRLRGQAHTTTRGEIQPAERSGGQFLEGYTAETYAKVMGGSERRDPHPTAPHQSRVYPLVLLNGSSGWVVFTPYRHTRRQCLLAAHAASVRSMRPSLQLERPHNPRHQISS